MKESAVKWQQRQMSWPGPHSEWEMEASQHTGTLPGTLQVLEERHVVPHPANTSAARVGAVGEQRHGAVKIIFRDLKWVAFFPESLRKHCLFGGSFCQEMHNAFKGVLTCTPYQTEGQTYSKKRADYCTIKYCNSLAGAAARMSLLWKNKTYNISHDLVIPRASFGFSSNRRVLRVMSTQYTAVSQPGLFWTRSILDI